MTFSVKLQRVRHQCDSVASGDWCGFERRLPLQASKAGNVRIYFFTWL